jgi:hypothetical protein
MSKYSKKNLPALQAKKKAGVALNPISTTINNQS